MTEQGLSLVAGGIIRSRTIAGKLEVTITTDNGSAVNLDAAKVQIYIQNPQGGKRKTICDVVSVRRLMELATLDPESCIQLDGSLVITSPGAGACTFTKVVYSMTGQIDLTKLVALTLEKDDELITEWSGLDAAHGILSVRTLEDNEHSGKHLSYEILSTEATRNRKFNTSGVNVMFIERTGSALSSIDIRHKSGFNVRMTPEEIDAHIRDNFGAVYNTKMSLAAGIQVSDIDMIPVAGYILVLDEDVLEVQVNTDGTAHEIILVSEKD